MVKSYRDDAGIPRQKQIEVIGYLHELEKEYDDPVAHFRAVARQRTNDEANPSILLKLDPRTKIADREIGTKNFGYVVLEQVYHRLELHKLLRRREKQLALDFSLNDIFRLLVYTRALNIGQKKNSYDLRDHFFEVLAQSQNDMYEAMPHLQQLNATIMSWLDEKIKKTFGRSAHKGFYYVTNITPRVDHVRLQAGARHGGESDTSPLYLGLLLDGTGYPIVYHLFSGDLSTKVTLGKITEHVRDRYEFDRLIVVADIGQYGSDRLTTRFSPENGYLYSQPIQTADDNLRQYILNQDDYRQLDGLYKCKSRICRRPISFRDGGDGDEDVWQKQVVFYSRELANLTRFERDQAVADARKYIESKDRSGLTLSEAAATYLHVSEDGRPLRLNEEKINEEAQLDGYYALISLDLDLSDAAIVEAYQGLRKIKEMFGISRAEWQARPPHVPAEAHIMSHFLATFMAIVILRIIEIELNQFSAAGTNKSKLGRAQRRFSHGEIIRTLNHFTCSLIDENCYNFTYSDAVIPYLEAVFDVDLSTKYRTLADIKKSISKAKTHR